MLLILLVLIIEHSQRNIKIQWGIIVALPIHFQMTHFFRCNSFIAVLLVCNLGQEIAPLKKMVNSTAITQLNKPYKFGDWDPAYGMTGIGIIYFPLQYYYDGGIRKGKPHGHGRIAWTNQDTYLGDISQGKASGQGKYQCVKRAIKYEGDWVDGHPSNGILSYNGTSSEVHFKKPNKLTITLKDGTIYSGDVAKRSNEYIIQGHGKMTFIDGSFYQGHWKEGHMHGRGQFTWKAGQKYKGDYHIGKKQGFGIYYYNPNKYYEGMWEDGKQHGDGSIYQNKQKIFSARWKNGLLEKSPSNDD